MKIDLTYKCSMGCTHCMGDYKPDGINMSEKVLLDTMDFLKRSGIFYIPGFTIVLSGGEIFEHPDVINYINTIHETMSSHNNMIGCFLILTTNGKVLANTPEYLDAIKKLKSKNVNIIIQVTNDERYYPYKLSRKEIFNLEKIDAVIEGVPSPDISNRNRCLYPQGRALENFTEKDFYTIAPKCVNCRNFAKVYPTLSFKSLINYMNNNGKFCTPTISPLGEIKIGESQLCPSVATIYDNESTIMTKIRHCKCTKCTYSIEKLKEYNINGYNLFMSDI